MPTLAARAEAERLFDAFLAAGAAPVDADALLPAETLLDLYGEDIRARAYVTDDPVRGEMMLRPDFTVPVVQAHIQSGAVPARYAYRGRVFRKQEAGSPRAAEYYQAGYEVIGATDPAAAEAEVFALLTRLLAPHSPRPVTGDIGVVTAALDAVALSAPRRAALQRHLWRPRRFRSLLDRFTGRADPPPGRGALMQALAATPLADLVAGAGLMTGMRGLDEVEARVLSLREEAQTPPLSRTEAQLLETVLSIKADLPDAIAHLRDVAVDLPGIGAAIDRIEARAEAIEARGVATATLRFEASFGRTTMEYYDGFVFGFLAPGRPDLPPVATGGRYDALTRVLGQGADLPAVGGVIRPDLLVDLEGRA